jgi:hypothetical protein
MKLRQPFFVTLMSTAAMLLLTTVAIPEAHAAGSTCSFRSNYFTGAVSPHLVAIYGAQAKIEYMNPDLCGDDSTGPSTSTAWAMVTAGGGYAQAGYGQFAAASGYTPAGIGTFAQYTLKCAFTGTCTGSTFKTKIDPATPTGTLTYDAYRSNSAAVLRMRVSGTVLLDSGYDPFGVWPSQWQAQYEGEVTHPESDVPGIFSNHVNFTGIKTLNSSGTFDIYTGTLITNTSSARLHSGLWNPGDGGQGVYIYTDPL